MLTFMQSIVPHMWIWGLLLSFSMTFFADGNNTSSANNGALVLLNDQSSSYQKGLEYLIPYLDHFGIPYDTLHIKPETRKEQNRNYGLYIIAHSQFISSKGIEKRLDDLLNNALGKGIGIVSFDPHVGLKPEAGQNIILTDSLVFTQQQHFITESHKKSGKFRLFGELLIEQANYPHALTLIKGRSAPLLVVSKKSAGRVAVWTTQDWMHTDLLGPLGGLDDCLWRSLVWAAKKPFLMQSLPPIITMRVDDVAGRGVLHGQSPLYWVNIASQYGFKPWLGLFIYNMPPYAVDELRKYISQGKATAAPHAFGGPPRPGTDHTSRGEYWYPDALPLRAETYDEFIFFDHHNRIPWSEKEMKKSLMAVDKWYTAHQPLPMSKYLLPHFYEIGSNAIDHVVNEWKMEYIGFPHGPDLSLHHGSCWLKAGPFRLHEESRPSMVSLPTYYADFVNIEGDEMFNFLCEIRDDVGYEWAPDNDVKATAKRGLRQLKRTLDSKALSVLFTHETDYIYKIKPENWEKEIKIIAEGLKKYDPIYMTMDKALQYVRAQKTSAITSWNIKQGKKTIEINLRGHTDITTHCYIYREKEDTIQSALIEVPVFRDKTQIRCNL